MTKNIIWLKNEINMQINDYSKYENDYAFGIVNGLQTALDLIENMDAVDNSVKIQKRMDILQYQIDEILKEVLISSERGDPIEIKQKEKE